MSEHGGGQETWATGDTYRWRRLVARDFPDRLETDPLGFAFQARVSEPFIQVLYRSDIVQKKPNIRRKVPERLLGVAGTDA